MVCACNLLAFQIEIALDTECSPTRKLAAKARINALLPMFQDAGETWRIAKWTFKVSEWVVKRAGLLMGDASDQANNAYNQARPRRDWNTSQQQDSGSSMLRNEPGLTNGAPFNIDDVLPDHWLQDFLGQSLFGQLDNDTLYF